MRVFIGDYVLGRLLIKDGEFETAAQLMLHFKQQVKWGA